MVFLSEQCATSKVTTSALHRPTIIFPLVCRPVENTLFEVQSFGLDTGPQSFSHSFVALLRIRCSKCSSLALTQAHNHFHTRLLPSWEYVVQSAVLWPWHRHTIVFTLVCCPVENTLFEVSPEICCLGVSSRYCSYRNHVFGFKPI